VVLTGGGTRSAVVQQLLADVLRRPVRRLSLRSASAIGAAVLAGRGVGMDVVPEAPVGAVRQPRADADLRVAQARWART
jgi:xylulokinase